MKLTAYLQALRPKQWTKNFIIFAAPLFAFSLNLNSLVGTVLALILFCCASSSFYLLNDIADIKADRLHPVKCKRPIASGAVKVPIAIFMAIFLLSTALIVGWLRAPILGVTILAYAILQVAYNLKLKKMVILDVMAISTGFVLRACAGGAATGIVISPWFLLCTAMLALFLGIEKRKAELKLLQSTGGKTRSVLKFYSLDLLDRMENLVTNGAVITYAIWSAGPVVEGASTPWMMVTLPFVLYGIFRYQILSNSNMGENLQTERPEEVLLKDLSVKITLIGWVATTLLILYLHQKGTI